MSYGMAAALQEAVYARLVGDLALGALVGDAIYDAVPAGTPPNIYISLGPEDVQDRSDGTGSGAWHRITIAVVADAEGFHKAKQVAGAVSDALVGADLTLTRGRVAGLHFFRANARRRRTGALRRIDLTFRVRVEDTA